MDALHCVASHGHRRFNRAAGLHRLPRRYTRLLVLRERGARQHSIAIDFQELGLEVDERYRSLGLLQVCSRHDT
jgi:hypothetical protein